MHTLRFRDRLALVRILSRTGDMRLHPIAVAVLLPLLVSCASRVKTPEQAIAIAHEACEQAIRESGSHIDKQTWQATRSGDRWLVQTESGLWAGLRVFVPVDGSQVRAGRDCIATVGHTPQPLSR